MASRLEAVEQGRRRFFSDMAHELRTPLATIRVLVEALQDSPGYDAKLREEYLRDLEGQLTRQERLVEDLLHLARAEERPQAIRRPVRAAELLALLEAAYRPLAEAKGLDWQADLQGGSAAGWVDEERLSLAAGNLVANAIAYTAAGAVRVVLYCGLEPPPPPSGMAVYRTGQASGVEMPPGGRLWALAVEDSGQGMAEEQLPLVLERFYRVAGAMSHCAAIIRASGKEAIFDEEPASHLVSPGPGVPKRIVGRLRFVGTGRRGSRPWPG